VKNIIAAMRANTITDRPSLQAYLLANTGYATTTALETAYRSWALGL
jgi:hypothetical protein